MEKRYPINLTVEQVALVLRGLSRVEKMDADAAMTLGDELTDVHSMTQAGMSHDDIQFILEKGSY